MGFIKPTPPPYDPIAWNTKPYGERAELACKAWAVQGYGTPIGAYTLYILKVAFYIYMWTFFVSFTPGLGGIVQWRAWIFEPIAFQKAILWSMLFEILGLGCGSGPLTGRYFPPVGGFLYFLRPGTTKLPLYPALPLLGGTRRSILDVLLYAGLLALIVRALIAPGIAFEHVLPIVALLPLLGVMDRTLFLAARGEHYWTTAVCFLFAATGGGAYGWLPGAKAVQLALWFWAGFSKLNRHFPYVVGVMTSNSPFTRFAWMRKLMYKNFPNDVNPSLLARIAGHWGTAVELGIPMILLLSPTGSYAHIAGMALMLGLHVYITSNVPMGVPIEWNFMVVYGAFFLFWAQADVSLLTMPLPLAVFLTVMLIALPLAGCPRRAGWNIHTRMRLRLGGLHFQGRGPGRARPALLGRPGGAIDRSTPKKVFTYYLSRRGPRKAGAAADLLFSTPRRKKEAASARAPSFAWGGPQPCSTYEMRAFAA